MKAISTALANHLKQATTTITTCWKITRMDGKVFTFTELDRDVTYGGLVYRSTGGFNKSAIKSTGTFAVDNLEVNGFLSDDTIPDEELRNGAFDYSEVEIFLINYMDTSMGSLKLRYGFFGEVRSAPSGMFIVELRGLIQLLAQRIGETYVPECKADLGDDRCKVSLVPPEYQQHRKYLVGHRVIVPTHAPADWLTPVRLPVVNADFEDGFLGGGGGNWTSGTSIVLTQGTINLDPYLPPFGDPEDNQWFVSLRHTVARPMQTISLTLGNSTTTRLDTGLCNLKFRGRTAALELNSGSSIQCVFVNASNVTLSTVSVDFGVQSPERVWKMVSTLITIPTGARSVRLYLTGYNNDPMGFMDTCWDDIELSVEFPKPITSAPDEYLDYRVYGGVEWEVTAATTGLSGSLVAADFRDETVVEDDGLTWTKVFPQHMFIGEVTEDATHSHVLKVSGLGSLPADWLNFGVLKFLSGKNVGRGVEVASLVDGTLRTLLPLPYPAKEGDVFQVHTGCNKSRTVCNTKFGNLANFRGEPDVPGLNQYFKVGGMT